MIRLSKSVLGKDDAEAVADIILRNGYLGMGDEVGRFEQDIAEYLDAGDRSVVCVSSGTAALHLAVEAIAKLNDEIIVPSLTFLSSFQAISAANCVPVACDVNLIDLTLDWRDVEKKISNKTRAIMPVYYASNVPDLKEIYRIANDYGLRVIEDAAHAFGCSIKERKVGATGDIVCFSFDGIKNITSGEGGAIVTADTEVAAVVKDTRLLGISKDSEKRYAGLRSWDFEVSRRGYRYHMSNIFAALGRSQLRKLDSAFAQPRIELASRYRMLLGGNERIRLLSSRHAGDENVIPHIFVCRILDGKRDGLRKFLEQNGVQTGVHYKPNHLLQLYGNGQAKLPITEMAYDQIISLPLHPELTMAEVGHICTLVNQFLEK